MQNVMTSSADQPTQPDTGSALDHAVRELWRLFLDMEVERDAVASAIQKSDFVDIEIAASDLVCAFRVFSAPSTGSGSV